MNTSANRRTPSTFSKIRCRMNELVSSKKITIRRNKQMQPTTDLTNNADSVDKDVAANKAGDKANDKASAENERANEPHDNARPVTSTPPPLTKTSSKTITVFARLLVLTVCVTLIYSKYGSEQALKMLVDLNEKIEMLFSYVLKTPAQLFAPVAVNLTRNLTFIPPDPAPLEPSKWL